MRQKRGKMNEHLLLKCATVPSIDRLTGEYDVITVVVADSDYPRLKAWIKENMIDLETGRPSRLEPDRVFSDVSVAGRQLAALVCASIGWDYQPDPDEKDPRNGNLFRFASQSYIEVLKESAEEALEKLA